MAVSETVEIKAPVERVWTLLAQSVEDPAAVWPGARATALERRPGSLLRELTLGGETVSERVTAFPARHEISAVLEEDVNLAGQSRLIIEPPLRPGLACHLKISLDWRRKDGGAAPDLSAAVAAAAQRVKASAES